MDDGSGIDAARVQAKAVSRGLLKGDEALSERDVVQLIFAQGFSTSDTVCALAGPEPLSTLPVVTAVSHRALTRLETPNVGLSPVA